MQYQYRAFSRISLFAIAIAMPCPSLTEYVEHRQEVFGRVQKEVPLSREDLKTCFITMLNVHEP